MTFTCTISSIAHQWSVPSIAISWALVPHDQGRVISNPPFQFAVTEVRTGTFITSTATVNVTADLNGTLVLCRDAIGMLPDQNSTITLRGMGIMYLYLDKQAVGNWIIIGHRRNMLRYPYMAQYVKIPIYGYLHMRLCPSYNVKIFES